MISSLTNTYTQSFPGTIWKILPDLHTGRILVEIRNQQKADSALFLIDLTSGSMMPVKIPLRDHNWWSTVHLIHKQLVVFSTFESAENPGIGHLYVHDIQEDKIILDYPNFRYLGFENGKMTGQQIEAEQVQQVTISLDETTDQFAISLPYLYRKDDADFAQLTSFFQSFGVNQLSQVELLPIDGYLFAAISYQAGKKSKREMMVLQQGKMIVREIMDEELAGETANGFMIIEKRMIFVQQQQILKIYEW